VVAVAVEDTSPAGAAQLANTFASAFVTQRSAAFQGQLANAIHRDEQLIAGGAGTTVKQRLVTLQSLQAQPDPTVRVAAQAATPSSSVWPNLPRLIGSGAGLGAAAGALVGLALLVLRRPGVRRPAEYDRGVSDEALEQLVDRLEKRLAARESALVARERDLQAKLDELRAAQAEATTAADAELAERGQQLTAREAELAERIAKVTKREVELARRAAKLAVRAREQEARAQREQEARAQREREAREREARRPPPPPEPEPEPEPERAAAPPVPAQSRPGNGTYNLTALERLVEERGAEFPDRVEEWTSYLFFLRDYAAADGSVPAGFDWLIQDTFRELVP
jgi:DNA repair exonuclease SbcCD ATPase subunit